VGRSLIRCVDRDCRHKLFGIYSYTPVSFPWTPISLDTEYGQATTEGMDEALGWALKAASYCSPRRRTTVRILSPPRTCCVRSTVISSGAHAPKRSSRSVAARSSAKMPLSR
jgi:hypothetical protein